MFCGNCGAEIKIEGAKFCTKCGTAITADVPKYDMSVEDDSPIRAGEVYEQEPEKEPKKAPEDEEETASEEELEKVVEEQPEKPSENEPQNAFERTRKTLPPRSLRKDKEAQAEEQNTPKEENKQEEKRQEEKKQEEKKQEKTKTRKRKPKKFNAMYALIAVLSLVAVALTGMLLARSGKLPFLNKTTDKTGQIADAGNNASEMNVPAINEQETNQPVNDTSTNTEAEVVEQEPVNPLSQKPEVLAYAELLQAELAAAGDTHQVFFELVYIDYDDVPELIIDRGVSGEENSRVTTSIYTYVNGAVSKVCTAQMMGGFRFADNRGNLFYFKEEDNIDYNNGTSYSKEGFYRIENGTLKEEAVFEHSGNGIWGHEGWNYFEYNTYFLNYSQIGEDIYFSKYQESDQYCTVYSYPASRPRLFPESLNHFRNHPELYGYMEEFLSYESLGRTGVRSFGYVCQSDYPYIYNEPYEVELLWHIQQNDDSVVLSVTKSKESVVISDEVITLKKNNRTIFAHDQVPISTEQEFWNYSNTYSDMKFVISDGTLLYVYGAKSYE